MSFMITLSEKAAPTPSTVPTYLIKGPFCLFALALEPPQADNLDCTEFQGSFQSDSHFPKVWKDLNSRSEATQSNKQKTRLLKKVRMRGWKAASQTSTQQVTTRQSLPGSRPASSLLTNKASPPVGSLMQAVGNAEVVSRSLSSEWSKSQTSTFTAYSTTQDSGKGLNFLA